MLNFKVGDLVSDRRNSAHSRNAAQGVYEIVRVLRGSSAGSKPSRGPRAEQPPRVD
jgi:hypothetical protein